MRAINRLSAQRIKSLPEGKHADGGGLWLHKRRDGGAQWVVRVTVHKARREMGLGGLKDVSLAQARELAAQARMAAKAGLDPVYEREKARNEGQRGQLTLAEAVADCFEARKAELKGDGKAGRWLSPLQVHVLPKLGKRRVTDIDQLQIRDTLKPIWHTKADVGQKAMNRLGLALKHAAALGLDVDLTAVDKAKALLGKSRHKPKNIPALHWREVPAFYASLADETPTNLALRLLILTGVRSGPIRFAHVGQIESDVWTVPAELMKGTKGSTEPFTVPLSGEAQAVIKAAMPFERGGLLFTGSKGKPISDMTMSALMRRRGLEARPHGFRSSLRSWIADNTDAPFEVAEAMLAHKVGSKVTQAYQRSDHLGQRRALLERWAQHCLGYSGEVVQMERHHG